MSEAGGGADPTGVSSAEAETPFFAGSIVGLRAWKVRPRLPSTATRLSASYTVGDWRPGGEWTVACCNGNRSVDGHRAPEQSCVCGLYAYHPDPDRAALLHALHVISPRSDEGELEFYGVIEACGRIEVHREGFRAERARPVALVCSPEWPRERRRGLEEVAELYGVEVLVTDEPEDVLDLCRERGELLESSQLEELLAARERAEAASGAGPTPPPTGASEILDRVWRAAEMAVMGAIAAIAGLVWLGFWAGVVAMVVGALFFGWLDPEPLPPPPAKLAAIEVDRESCRVEVEVVTRRSLNRIRVRVTGREAGDGLGHFERSIRSIPAGRSTQRAATMRPKLCHSRSTITTQARILWRSRTGNKVVAKSPPWRQEPQVGATEPVCRFQVRPERSSSSPSSSPSRCPRRTRSATPSGSQRLRGRRPSPRGPTASARRSPPERVSGSALPRDPTFEGGTRGEEQRDEREVVGALRRAFPPAGASGP